MRKRILVISPYFPFPANNGGKVRMYNLICHLARHNDVYLLSYIDQPHMTEFVPAMEKVCRKVYTVLREENKRIVNDTLPRSVSFFYTPEMINTLERVLDEVRPQLVQIDFLIMTQYVNHLDGIPVVYTEHDISNINFEQSFHDRDLPETHRFVEWNKLVKFEKQILPRFKSIIVLTERDRRILAEFIPGLSSVLIPTGVDIDHYMPDPGRKYEGTGTKIAYVGHYRHYPNFDAAAYFIKDIFPHIRAEIPEAVFYAIGSGVTPQLQELAGPSVVVTGEVVDVKPHLSAADVFVAPVRLGGGIKGKILEAMACGVPVVATQETSQGVACVPGEDFLVAGDARDFAAKTLALMKDPALRRTLSANARRRVEELYDWNQIALHMDTYYDSLLGSPVTDNR